MKKLFIYLFLICNCSAFLSSCLQESLLSDLSQEDKAKSSIPRSMEVRTIQGAFNASNELKAPGLDCLPVGLKEKMGSDFTINGFVSELGEINALKSFERETNCFFDQKTMLLRTSGYGQISSASGDLVYFTSLIYYSSNNLMNRSSSPTHIAVSGLWTINGGTGKYACAKGSIAISGDKGSLTGTFKIIADGSITY